jgi:hypothetical protein
MSDTQPPASTESQLNPAGATPPIADQIASEVATLTQHLADLKTELEAAKVELAAKEVEAAASEAALAALKTASPIQALASIVSGRLSADPLFADREVRAIAAAEAKRIESVLTAPGPLTAQHLVSGLLGIQ